RLLRWRSCLPWRENCLSWWESSQVILKTGERHRVSESNGLAAEGEVGFIAGICVDSVYNLSVAFIVERFDSRRKTRVSKVVLKLRLRYSFFRMLCVSLINLLRRRWGAY